jgi:ferredoxin
VKGATLHRYVLTNKEGKLILQEAAAGDLSHITEPLLLSGFSIHSPDSSCPLSSALQLNADLSTPSVEQLNRIAIAERKKLLSTQIKNYLYTVEPRAAVIAAESELLADFLDLYGGLLETVPIFFSSTSRPEYVPAAELDVQTTATGGYRLRCSSRVPIDRQQCTWCRSCSAACAEQCIDSNLHIDFNRCTFCGHCVYACPSGAIDLYARMEKEFHVPAIILLGDPELELPADRQMIFKGDEIGNFLSQIGNHQVEETVAYHRERCQYSGRLDLGCHQCFDACPHGALSRNDSGIAVDHLTCRNCGSCIAACPTGALQEQEFTDKIFTAYFEGLSFPEHAVIVLGSEQDLRELWWHHAGWTGDNVFFLEYPQVNALTAMHYLFLFALGFAQAAVLNHAGAAAEISPAKKELELTNKILEQLFAIPDFAIPATDKNIHNIIISKNRKNPLPELYDNFSYHNRRQKTASILQFLIAAGAEVEAALPTEACATCGQVLCDDDKCTACVACLNECHTGALHADQEHYTLKHIAALCVQCGICVAVCPEQALTLHPGLVLTPRFFQSAVLSRAEPMICKRCGTQFGTRKSYQHVMNLLREAGRFAEQEEVLAYCETCRAVKMFESYE